MKSLPYFHADLVARIIPGALVVGLIALLELRVPEPWLRFLPAEGGLSPVVVPVLLLGAAYVLGTLLEALISPQVERVFVSEFRTLGRDYSWGLPLPVAEPPGPGEPSDADWKTLSHRAVGRILMGESKGSPPAIAHLIRFHSEAKMCAALALILLAVCLPVLIGCLDGMVGGEDSAATPCHRLLLLLILLVLALGSVKAFRQRLHQRALFAFRAMEHLRSSGKHDPILEIRKDLRAFSVRMRGARP